MWRFVLILMVIKVSMNSYYRNFGSIGGLVLVPGVSWKFCGFYLVPGPAEDNPRCIWELRAHEVFKLLESYGQVSLSTNMPFSLILPFSSSLTTWSRYLIPKLLAGMVNGATMLHCKQLLIMYSSCICLSNYVIWQFSLLYYICHLVSVYTA